MSGNLVSRILGALLMRAGKHIVWIIILSLFFQIAALPVDGKAAQKSITITEFYNDGVLGESYYKAIAGAVVTISNAEEMKIFFHCLDDKKWTDGISFRQEADISFGNYSYSYDKENDWINIYKDGGLFCVSYRSGSIYRNNKLTSLDKVGLSEACIQRDMQLFSGEYDGQGYSVSGFIVQGRDTMHNGIFGYLTENASVHDVNIKNCFILKACGTICGLNDGIITNCSAQSVVGMGWCVGGIAESSCGTMQRCYLKDATLLNDSDFSPFALRFGGIASAVYIGKISDCAVENLNIYVDQSQKTYAGGVVGYQSMGDVKNCSFFGSCAVPFDGQDNNVGGIVGYIDNYSHSSVYNCISAGDISGGTAGGLVGKSGKKEENSDTTGRIENCVSFSKVSGNTEGALVGALGDCALCTCYSYNQTAKEAVGNQTEGTQADCHVVNREQVYGMTEASVIDNDGWYSKTNHLLEALNDWVRAQTGYLMWETGEWGYPILSSGMDRAPSGDYELGDGVEIMPSNTPEVSESPEQTTMPSVTDIPDITEAPSATERPDVTESPESSEKPDATTTPDITELPSATERPDITQPPAATKTPDISLLQIKKLKAKLTKDLRVNITWKKTKKADGYLVYRSDKKSSGYKTIADVTKNSYVDKKAKRGQFCYYMVRPYVKNAGKVVCGKGKKQKIRVLHFPAPVLHLSKGLTSDGKTYMQAALGKHSGSYIEVYFRTNGKTYVRAPLRTEKISFYKGKLRFTYKNRNTLYCKVRTYQIKQGKKCYSLFSKEKKIRL